MKTIIVRSAGGPENIEVLDVPDPVPGPGEILIHQKAISVMGAHSLVRAGRYRFQAAFPVRLGTDSTGIVESVGSGVTDYKAGDPVYASWRALPKNPGFYGEKIVIPASSAMALPANADLERTLSIGLYSSAWAMLNEGPAGRDYKSVLIVGSSGAIGICAVQLAKLAGKTVIGLVSSPEKAEFVKKNGADHTINYKTENIVQRVREVTGGRGVDLLIDHLGGANFTDYFDMLAPWGTIVSINGVAGSPSKDTFEEGRNHAKLCVSIRFFAMHYYETDPEGRKRVLDAVMPLVMGGKVNPHVAARFHVSEARNAHELFDSGKAMGRIILTA